MKRLRNLARVLPGTTPPPDPFAGLAPDPGRQAAVLARPLPPVRLVIWFTPRSSSTRLTEILAATRRLGHANEVFNPRFAARPARSVGAADAAGYARLIVRAQAVAGVWSCEITAHQLAALFGSGEDFLQAVQPTAHLWLIRRDIVAQAVSLAKMVATGIGHTPQAGGAARAAADAGYGYDGRAIRHWIGHLRRAEIASEALFRRHGLQPLRLSYEQLTGLAPQQVVDLVAAHLGLPPPAAPVAEGARLAHQKLGTARNAAQAGRFARENPAFLRRLARQRAPMLALLRDPPQAAALPPPRWPPRWPLRWLPRWLPRGPSL